MTGSIFSSIRVSKISASFMVLLPWCSQRQSLQNVSAVHELLNLSDEAVHARLHEHTGDEQNDRSFERGVVTIPERLHQRPRAGRRVERGQPLEDDDRAAPALSRNRVAHRGGN